MWRTHSEAENDLCIIRSVFYMTFCLRQHAFVYDSQQQVTCRSQTSFVGIAGGEGEGGGVADREGGNRGRQTNQFH